MKLNLGCGYRKLPDYINIDNRAEVEPDLVFDVIQGLPYEDGSIEEIAAYDFLEHIPPDNVIKVIEDIWRALKPEGVFDSLTPSTDGRGAFQDPTHRSFWNINSWLYYTAETYRKLIGTKADFRGIIRDIITDDRGHIIHTHARLYAIK